MITTKLARTIKYLALSLLVLVAACNRYDDEINGIRTEIAQIKEALTALQNAYDAGKIINSITPIEDEAQGGWIITFSDNTSIKITNAKSAITPYIKIDEDGFGDFYVNRSSVAVWVRKENK
jgi:hypothetical protein